MNLPLVLLLPVLLASRALAAQAPAAAAGIFERYDRNGDGKVTAIDILRTAAEKALQEKIRLAIDDAVRAATPAPTLVNGGQPFRSRWLFAATWFIDPPGCLLSPSMGAAPGQFAMGCGGSFDVTSEGLKTSSFDVQQKVTAELLRILPLQR